MILAITYVVFTITAGEGGKIFAKALVSEVQRIFSAAAFRVSSTTLITAMDE